MWSWALFLVPALRAEGPSPTVTIQSEVSTLAGAVEQPMSEAGILISKPGSAPAQGTDRPSPLWNGHERAMRVSETRGGVAEHGVCVSVCLGACECCVWCVMCLHECGSVYTGLSVGLWVHTQGQAVGQVCSDATGVP
jgi:hypothetical protein